MSTDVIVYVLTGLALVVVVLTRLRMRQGQGAGRAYVGTLLLNMHTGSGLLAVVSWVLFLVFSEDSALGDPLVGIIALTFWWIVTVCGLLMLVRWLPSRGRHASEGFQDSWSEGPGLSILAHVGMLVGVCIFTYTYLFSKV
ncbi:hypothetical protein [Nocardioides sp.]|uniref:hypothetical protein n=1 Tax=Nocardioides sp. TaxID=35761 RepID=UPI001A1F087C|nr:hypothetical protein [Nocardioides sp.]MBJ7357608.1 hypothetical protein [Nocardioides sp.]